MEFKLNGSADDALRQIEEKRYADPFRSDSRQLFEIGVRFSAERRNIDTWKVRGGDRG